MKLSTAISITQILNIWDQLHAAMQKTNTYGGDVAEIYVYAAMSHSPTFAKNPSSMFCREEVREANQAIYDICREFMHRHNVDIVFESDSELESLLDMGAESNTWRIHLRVKEI